MGVALEVLLLEDDDLEGMGKSQTVGGTGGEQPAQRASGLRASTPPIQNRRKA